jgi:hypothetical protein
MVKKRKIEYQTRLHLFFEVITMPLIQKADDCILERRGIRIVVIGTGFALDNKLPYLLIVFRLTPGTFEMSHNISFVNTAFVAVQVGVVA